MLSTPTRTLLRRNPRQRRAAVAGGRSLVWGGANPGAGGKKICSFHPPVRTVGVVSKSCRPPGRVTLGKGQYTRHLRQCQPLQSGSLQSRLAAPITRGPRRAAAQSREQATTRVPSLGQPSRSRLTGRPAGSEPGWPTTSCRPPTPDAREGRSPAGRPPSRRVCAAAAGRAAAEPALENGRDDGNLETG